ncbi:MAG: trehalase family glycosidase [Lentisphaeria bacterium]
MDLASLQRTSWAGGRLLAFSGLDGATRYDIGLVARTAAGAPAIEVMLPGEARLEFPAAGLAEVTLAGDWFSFFTTAGRVRGAFLDACHLLLDGPCELRGASPAVAVQTAGSRTLVGSATAFDSERIGADLEAALAARQRWLRELPVPDAGSAAARRTLALALSVMKVQCCTPEGRMRHRWTTPDRWPHRGMWLWDSVFHAIGWRHFDPALAREMIDAVFDHQAADGRIPHAMTPAGASEITQPPVLAFGVQQVLDAEPRPDWLAALYPRLAAYVQWDLANRDTDGAGLAEWFIEGNPMCRSGESGMDNSPRFDTATQLDAVDFNSFLALECETLAGFARQLGRPAEARNWEERHAVLCRLIRERLWSEAHRFFVDYDVTAGAPSPVLASSGFLPLICGAATPEQAQELARHLADPATFGTPLPVPSVAAGDTAHYAKDMWRGPVWVNLNWLIAMGFERYGLAAAAAGLRARTRAEIERCCERYGTFFEFYDDRGEVEPPRLLRKGRCAPEVSPYLQVVHDYGWTTTLYADLVCREGKNRGMCQPGPEVGLCPKPRSRNSVP